MHFLLFLPDRHGAKPEHLTEAGLGHLLRPDDAQPMFCDLAHSGPGDRRGVLVGWMTAGMQDLQYLPTRQTWVEGNGYWVGWDTQNPPTAADLERKTTVAGHILELGDGKDWLIPSATKVPHLARFCKGAWLEVADPAYQSLLEDAAWSLDQCLQLVEHDHEIPLIAATEHAFRALCWNYRLVGEVASHLALFNGKTLFPILAHFSDVEQVRKVAQQLGKLPAAPTPPG